MSRPQIDGERLTVYCLESDHFEHKPLHEWLMSTAMELGIARGTVLRAYAGFGRRRRMHYQKLLALSDDLALRIEFIDTPEKIARLLDAAEQALDRYTFAREQVRYHPPLDD